MAKSGNLKLIFVNADTEAYLKRLSLLLGEGCRTFRLRPLNEDAIRFYNATISVNGETSFFVKRADVETSVPAGITLVEEDKPADVHVLFYKQAKMLSKALLEYLDLESGCILAPKTEHYHQNRQHYVITIPKSGTHLLCGLLGLFGIGRGPNPPDVETPGTWNSLAAVDTHTDFGRFLPAIPWQTQAARNHPFFRSPAILMYRNPLDVIVSECSYMKKYDNTPFAYFFNNIEPSKVIPLLISGYYPLGTIVDRFFSYVGWLSFPNVIPVSFEELVGPEGGADAEEQKRVIWSLQLKLHVSGEPDVYARKIFNQNSPTFFAGQIGSHRNTFTYSDYAIFKKLCQSIREIYGENFDLMETFGYEIDKISSIPKHAHKFRRRPLDIIPPPPLKQEEKRADWVATRIPIDIVKSNGYSLFLMGGKYYGIPFGFPEIHLNGEDLDYIDGIVSGSTVEEVLAKTKGYSPLPINLQAYRDYNLVLLEGYCYALPRTLGRTLDLSKEASAVASVERLIDTTVHYPPQLVGSHKGYNIVDYDNLFYGVPQSLGMLDLSKEGDRNHPEILVGKDRAREGVIKVTSLDEAIKLIDLVHERRKDRMEEVERFIDTTGRKYPPMSLVRRLVKRLIDTILGGNG